MSGKEFRVDVISDREGLLALKRDWNDLFTQAKSTQLSLSFEWIWCAWEIMVEPSGGRLCVIVVWKGERPALIWPLVIRKHKGLWTAIQPLGAPEDYADILVDPADGGEDLVRMAWSKLATIDGADLLLLCHVRRDSLLSRSIPPSHCKVIESQPAPSVTPAAFCDWETYWMSLDRNFRRNVDRRHRRLEETGVLRFEVVTARERLQETVQWLLAYKRDWLARKGLTGSSLTMPGYDAFLQHATGGIVTFGHLIGFAITLDDSIVAVQLATVCGSAMSSLHIAYDAAYSKFSPGHILHKYSLRWAFDRQLDCDFRFGVDEHKRILGNACVEVVSTLSCRTGWGRLFEYVRMGANLPPVRPLRRALTRPLSSVPSDRA
jgi:CelD/BcsL family acetyltransferase involved in cellulose biosynthesis